MHASICTRCHGQRIRKGLNGNPALELVLYLLFIVPGLIYSWTGATTDL